jgi:hypothetical protein
MGMSFSRKELVDAAVGKMTVLRGLGMDPLDDVELVEALRAEFGAGVVAEAVRRLERRRNADPPRPTPGGPHPLWDRDLDG